jgi:hypothetical protein
MAVAGSVAPEVAEAGVVPGAALAAGDPGRRRRISRDSQTRVSIWAEVQGSVSGLPLSSVSMLPAKALARKLASACSPRDMHCQK